MPDALIHPTPQELTAFGLGQLPEAAAAAVAGHLEVCPVCRQAVANLPPDALRKTRAARPSDSSVPSRRTVTLLGGASGTANERSAAPAPVPGLPPELVNHPRYRIVRELGRGGMGVVYQAVQTLMDRPVAIKVINPSVLAHPDALPRFQSEVKTAAKLDHPNIVRAHDAEQVGDLHLLVMEYVEGTSLADLVQRKGPLPLAYACHFIRQAALGLQHAFEQGMVHRDVKPQNLMVTPKGQVKILDFGLARLRGGQTRGGGLTEAGAFMGTPEYVSPEQATDARTADTRADLYSLGCTLYFLLTGQPPFPEDTAVKMILAHIEKPPPSLSAVRPDVPSELAAVVERTLAKDPGRRYQQPVELAQALVPFIKQGTKPVVADAAGQTAKLPKGLTTKPPPLATPAKEAAPEPFAALGEATAPMEQAQTGTAAAPAAKAWYRRPPVLAGAGGTVLVLGLGVWLVAGGAFDRKAKTRDGGVAETKEPTTPGPGQAPNSSSNPRAVQATDTADGFEPLFDGKDLKNGWSVEDGDPASWVVEHGAIVAHGADWKTSNYLVTNRAFANFILRLEFNLDAGAQSALALRAGMGEQDHPHISLADSAETGMTHWLRNDTWVKPDRPAELKWFGEWNQLEVEINGRTLRLMVNGRPVVHTTLEANARFSDGGLPGLNRVRGRIGLQKHTGTVRFRHLRIKELPPSPAEQKEAKADLNNPDKAAAPVPVTLKRAETKKETPSRTDQKPDPFRDLIKKARAEYDAALKGADDRVLAAFDRELAALAAAGKLTDEERRKAIAAMKNEKLAFQKHGTLPWSPPMRAAAIEYLPQINAAAIPLGQAYDQALAAQRQAGGDSATRALAAEKKQVLTPKVVGIWNCTGLRRHARFSYTLYANGHINTPDSKDTWKLTQNELQITLHRSDSRSGLWMDTCTIAPHGEDFTAKPGKLGRDWYKGKLVRESN